AQADDQEPAVGALGVGPAARVFREDVPGPQVPDVAAVFLARMLGIPVVGDGVGPGGGRVSGTDGEQVRVSGPAAARDEPAPGPGVPDLAHTPVGVRPLLAGQYQARARGVKADELRGGFVRPRL